MNLRPQTRRIPCNNRGSILSRGSGFVLFSESPFQMPLNTYIFRDDWRFPFPPYVVWPHIVTATEYPAWWGRVYAEVRPLNEIPPDQVGSTMAVTARGRLPYRIRFTGTVTRVEPPFRLGLVATGDLTGEGLWELNEIADGTDIVFHWTVRADKPLIRLLSPILRPLFAWNHRWTMQVGEAALRARLADRSR